MWRRRRWRKLLSLIDHLPPNSYYHQAVMNDPEHAAAIVAQQARAKAEGKDTGTGKPPLSTWSAEVSMMAKVLDAVRHLQYLTVAVNGSKNAQPPKPEPRPGTALEAADRKRRQADHEKLTARLIRR